MVVMEIVSTVKNKIHSWRERRFLRKHGCRSWWEYNRKHDLDFDLRANNLADSYHGYPYRHVFDHYNHYCYKLLADYGPGGLIYGFHRMEVWCKDNIKHKFRIDAIRLSKIQNEWHINELSGEDRVVFAFKDKRDFLWFQLRWS